MAAQVNRYWKNIRKDASYTGCKESSYQKLTTKMGTTKSNLQNQNTNCVYLLSSTQILKAFNINRTRVSHCRQNPSLPNTSITYHVVAASTSNVVMGDTLNHPKWIWEMTLLKRFWTRSWPQQLSVDTTWPIKFQWNGWPKNNGGNRTAPRTAWPVPNHSSQ